MNRVGVVEGLGQDGMGLIRTGGKVTFVPDCFPGEEVRFEVVESDPHFDRAKLVEVLKPSAERRASPCPHDHAGGCGGCPLLTLDPATSTAVKVQALRSLLDTAAIPHSAWREVGHLPANLGYRNHARFYVEADGALSYVARSSGSNKGRGRIAVSECPVLEPRLERLRQSLVGKLRGAREVEIRLGIGTGEKMTVVYGDAKPAGLDPVAIESACLVSPRKGALQVLRGHPYFHEQLLGQRLRISHDVPLRGSTAGLEQLSATVLALSGPLTPATRVLDLYAGAGALSVTAFRSAGRVIAAESQASAILDFRENVRAHRHISLRDGAPAEVVVDLVENKIAIDLAYLDLPRVGLDSATFAALQRLRPPQILLVSAEPKTFLRDLSRLLGSGYTLASLTPLDLLPGTASLEVVASLVIAKG